MRILTSECYKEWIGVVCRLLIYVVPAVLILLLFDPGNAMLNTFFNKVNTLPDKVKSLFGFNSIGFKDITDCYMVYIWIWNIYLSYHAVTRVAKSIGTEEHNGTMVYLYTQTFSKVKIILAKFLAHIILHGSMLAGMFLTTVILSVKAVGKGGLWQEHFPYYIKIFGIMFLVQVVLICIGMLYGAIRGGDADADNFAIFFTVLTFILGNIRMIGNLDMIHNKTVVVKLLNGMALLSPVSWSNPYKTISDGTGLFWGIFASAVLVICIVGGLLIYRGREFN